MTREYNPTGEEIIPSIRWEALRAGIQTARLLLHIKAACETGDLPAPLCREVQQVLADIQAMCADQSKLTNEWVSDCSRRVRVLYVRATRS